jgi:hypothetical protein
MAGYKNAEHADEHFIFGFCNGNALAAVRGYQRRYAEGRQPDGRALQFPINQPVH